MLTEKKNMFHATHPSLLPLRMALIAAERESPPQPQPDANEQLALKLIETMKTEHKKPLPFLNWMDIPTLHGFREGVQKMAVIHA